LGRAIQDISHLAGVHIDSFWRYYVTQNGTSLIQNSHLLNFA
jgi:hypothetical protein